MKHEQAGGGADGLGVNIRFKLFLPCICVHNDIGSQTVELLRKRKDILERQLG